MIEALLVVAGYLCGSLPFGYWLVRWFRGTDIRSVGSGNIGATNVWRTYGARLGSRWSSSTRSRRCSSGDE